MGAGGDPQLQKASTHQQDADLQQALDSYQACAVRRLQYRVDRILTPLLSKPDLLRFSVQFSALLDECLSAVASSTARGANFLAPLPAVRDDSACPRCLSHVSQIFAQYVELRSEQQAAFVDWLKASSVPVTAPRLPVVPIVHTSQPSTLASDAPLPRSLPKTGDDSTGSSVTPSRAAVSRPLRRRRPPPYFGGINVDALAHLYSVEKKCQGGTGGGGVRNGEARASGAHAARGGSEGAADLQIESAALARAEVAAATASRHARRVAATVDLAAAAAANAAIFAKELLEGVEGDGAGAGVEGVSRAAERMVRASCTLASLGALMKKEVEATSVLCISVGGVQGMGSGVVGRSTRARGGGGGGGVAVVEALPHNVSSTLPSKAGLPLSVAYGKAPDVLRKLAGAVADGTGGVLGVAATAGLVETEVPPPPRAVKVYGVVSRSAAVVFGSPIDGDTDVSVGFAPLGAPSIEYVVRVYSDVAGVVEVFGGEQFGECGADVTVDSTARVAQRSVPLSASDVDHTLVFEEVVKGTLRGGEVRLRSLQPQRKYVVVVSARNVVGEGRGSGVLFCTAAAPPTTVDGVDSYGAPCVYADVPVEHKPTFGLGLIPQSSPRDAPCEATTALDVDNPLSTSRPDYSDGLFGRASPNQPRFAVGWGVGQSGREQASPSGEASSIFRDGVSVAPPEGLGGVEGGDVEVIHAARMAAVTAAAEVFPAVAALCEASRGRATEGVGTGAQFPSRCVAALGLAVFVTYGGASVRGGGVFLRPPAGVRHAAESVEGGGRATYHTARALLQWSAVDDLVTKDAISSGYDVAPRPPPLPASAPFYRGTWEGEGVRARADGVRVPVATVGAYNRGCGTYTVDVDADIGKSRLSQSPSGAHPGTGAADAAVAADPLPRGVCAEDVAIEAALGMLAAAESGMPYGV